MRPDNALSVAGSRSETREVEGPALDPALRVRLRQPRWRGLPTLTPLVLVFLIAACATLGTLFSTPDRIRFNHARHAEAKVDCLQCHDTVFDAENLSAELRPMEKTCLGCHRDKKDKGECSFCHTQPDHPAAWPKPDTAMAMSHAKHLELPEINEKCDACHVELSASTLGKPAKPPEMAKCTGCHEHQEQFAAGGCNACHLDLSRFALKPVSAFSHQADYTRSHRLDARTKAGSCAMCHEQTFCSDCHAAATRPAKIEAFLPERIDRSFIHLADYESKHVAEAQADPALCQRCHGTSFCENCHLERGLLPGAPNAKNPHPTNWADPVTGGGHGKAARENIATCAACHDQGAASNCVSCHKVGGVGGNPHPPSWLLRHSKKEIDSNPMCLACHP